MPRMNLAGFCLCLNGTSGGVGGFWVWLLSLACWDDRVPACDMSGVAFVAGQQCIHSNGVETSLSSVLAELRPPRASCSMQAECWCSFFKLRDSGCSLRSADSCCSMSCTVRAPFWQVLRLKSEVGTGLGRKPTLHWQLFCCQCTDFSPLASKECLISFLTTTSYL